MRGKRLAVVSTGSEPALPPHFAEPLRLTCEYLGMRFVGTHYAQFKDGQMSDPCGHVVASAFGDAPWPGLENEPRIDGP